MSINEMMWKKYCAMVAIIILIISIFTPTVLGTIGGGPAPEDTTEKQKTEQEQTCQPSCECQGSTLVCKQEDCSTTQTHCKYGCEDGECIKDDYAPVSWIVPPPAGWYSMPIFVEIKCRDIGPAGCEATYYCFALLANEHCNFVRYARPIKLECSEGSICTIRLRYYSVDKEGNKELAKSAVFKFDRVPPEVEFYKEEKEGYVSITLKCKDTGSGCKKLYYRVRTPEEAKEFRSTSREEKEITLSGEGTYIVEYYAEDEAGNIGSVEIQAVSVSNVGTDFKIQGIKVSAKQREAIIYFETTMDAIAYVKYGKSKSVLNKASETSSGVTHAIKLKMLDPETTYYYKIVAKSKEHKNVTKESSTLSFKTASAELKIFAIDVVSSATTASISWRTNVEAECVFEYGINSYELKVETKRSKEHSIMLTNLRPGNVYSYRIVAKNDYARAEAYGTFVTSETPAGPAIEALLIEPESKKQNEGNAFIFRALVANASCMSYIWNFGDETIEQGSFDCNAQEVFNMQFEATAIHAYYLPENYYKDAKDFNVSFVLVDRNGKEVDRANVSVTVLKAPVKVKLIEPKGPFERGKTAEIKIQITDSKGNPMDLRGLWYINARIGENKFYYTKGEKGTVILKGQVPVKISSKDILKIYAPIELLDEKELYFLKAEVPLTFTPATIVPELKAPKTKYFYIGEKISYALIGFKICDENTKLCAPLSSSEVIAKFILVAPEEKKIIEAKPLAHEKAFYADINYHIPVSDLNQELVLMLKARDAYGNSALSKLSFAVLKDSPKFNLELVNVPKVASYGQEMELLAKIEPEHKKAQINVDCGIEKGTMAYDAFNNLYSFILQVPLSYQQEKLKCTLFAEELKGSGLDLETISIEIRPSIIEFIFPKEGSNALSERLKELRFRVSYANGAFVKGIEHVSVCIDGKLCYVAPVKLQNNTYVVKLQKPLNFGSHSIELRIEEQTRASKTIFVNLSKKLSIAEVLAGIAIAAFIASLAYLFLKLRIAAKDAKEKLLMERDKTLALLHKLQAQYYKKVITEKEFKERYAKTKARLRAIEASLKSRSYMLGAIKNMFWKKK